MSYDLFLLRRDGVLGYDQPPDDVASFVRSLPGGNAEIARISPDQVLDRELIDKYSRTTP
jgi:hypothetical protein